MTQVNPGFRDVDLRGWCYRILLVAALAGMVTRMSFADDPAPGAKPAAPARYRVIGYLPEYRVSELDPQIGNDVTDLIYFSARVTQAGTCQLPADYEEHLTRLHKIRDEHGTALHLCVGGWERSSGFPEVAATDAGRRNFSQQLLKICLDQQLDGIDLDWEHPASAAEQKNHGLLVRALRETFADHPLQISLAVAGWQSLDPEAIEAADRIHLMAYDAAQRHSTLEFADSEITKLERAGVPLAKICLGVPLYGRGIEQPGRVLTYREISDRWHPAPEVDEVEGIYFNGARTLERKARLALARKLGGLMIWEVGQDAPANSSLIKILHETLTSRALQK